MNKPATFQRDLAAMQDEMKNVARILEASKTGPVAKTIDLDSKPSAERPPASGSKPRSPRPSRASVVAESEPPRPTRRMRENVTTRLTVETNRLLTEAALRQKLKPARPDTRQDIIETAVIEWFKKHGYDRRKRPAGDSESELSQAALEAAELKAAEPGDEETSAQGRQEFPLETLPNTNTDND